MGHLKIKFYSVMSMNNDILKLPVGPFGLDGIGQSPLKMQFQIDPPSIVQLAFQRDEYKYLLACHVNKFEFSYRETVTNIKIVSFSTQLGHSWGLIILHTNIYRELKANSENYVPKILNKVAVVTIITRFWQSSQSLTTRRCNMCKTTKNAAKNTRSSWRNTIANNT